MVREPIFHTCTTFFHNSFFSRLPFFEYATSNQLFYREKCIFYAYTDKTDCRYKLTHRFRFHIYAKKKPAFLANKVRVFCGVFPRTDDFYTNFFRCFSSSWISICAVYHFQHPARQQKSTSLHSGAFLSANRKICKRIHLHGGVYRKFNAGS